MCFFSSSSSSSHVYSKDKKKYLSQLLKQKQNVRFHSIDAIETFGTEYHPMSNTKHVRSRYPKSYPPEFLVGTDEKYDDPRNKHDGTQILLMIFTALVYLFHTLRAYIPADFGSNLAIRPITRVYTSDLRPGMVTESLLFRLAENWQTFWLLYVLSYIPRRTNSGYLYRNPNIFSSLHCFLLISALALQTISQLSLSPEISCACLYTSLILLIIICRTIAVKLNSRSASSFGSIDQIILRYFVLNSLFLYTTSIAYSSTCATVEYLGIYFDPDATLPETTSLCTTIGLAIIFFLLVVYFLLDQFVYRNEFWSIWTPYLFIAYAFICPPLRSLSLLDNDTNLNYYLFWALFSFTVLIMLIRLWRQISLSKKSQQ